MASETVSTTDKGNHPPLLTVPGRLRRIIKENLIAYAFLTPALILIFTFGIFPIFYAAYVSLYRWRIKQGRYVGISNYVTAMGDIAYLFFIVISLGLVGVAVYTAVKAVRAAREKHVPLPYAVAALLPAAVMGYGILQLLLRAVTVFAQEGGETLGSVPLGATLLALGGGMAFGLYRFQHRRLAKSRYSILPNFTTPALTIILSGGAAFILLQFTYSELITSDTLPVSVLRLRWLLMGFGLLGVSYGVWNWSTKQESTLRLVGGILGAAGLIGAGVYFINIWDLVSAGADPDFYLSLQVTVFYSLGTVPFQLVISMFLAILLYQNLRAKGLFRVIFFIPYIAPAVATAGVFEAIFSIRPSSFANLPFTAGGTNSGNALAWLKEARPAVAILGEAMGFESMAALNFGPSLALLVIILFNIWVFVGYDTVIFLAGLGNIPGTLYEAARIDGANRWQLFRNITLPLLSPTTYFLSVISVIGTFKAFNHIWVLRDTAALGTTDTASVYFFNTFIRGTRYGYATSMAMVLFIIILLLQIAQNRIAAKRVFYG